jgi:hypothetical protein
MNISYNKSGVIEKLAVLDFKHDNVKTIKVCMVLLNVAMDIERP